MTPIEIIALITALIIPIKLAMLMKSQRLWFNKVTTKFWGGSGNLTMVLAFIVAAGSLFFLLQELTIVQIWATMFFSMALIVMALAPFSKYMLKAEDNWFSETNTIKKGWLATIVWVAISIWVILSLFS